MTIDCGICTLRPWQSGDARSLRENADDPAVANNLRDRFPSPYTERDAQLWISQAQGVFPAQHLAIDIAGTAIGGIGCDPGFEHTERSAEVGYWLGTAHHGRGIATAAVRGLTPYLFDTFDFARLFASVYSRNLASQRVLEKCGWTREALMRDAETKRGELIDLVLFSLLARDR
jgi:RimJ/RimL family protein N-acetyltransferase